MTARQAAQRMHAAAHGFANAAREGLIAGGEAATKAAVKTSSGNISTYELGLSVKGGGWAHPYGYGRQGSAGPRGRTPFGNLAIVNVQSGDFRSRWHGGVTGWRFDVSNDDRKARWILDGNAYTKPRPYDRPIMRVGEKAIAREVKRRTLNLFRPFIVR